MAGSPHSRPTPDLWCWGCSLSYPGTPPCGGVLMSWWLSMSIPQSCTAWGVSLFSQDPSNDWQWVVLLQDHAISTNPSRGVGAGFWTPLAAAPPPGLEWFVKSSGQWWWFIVLAVSHHGPLTGPPWAGLAASAMTVVSLSWFCQLGWSQFCWLEWSNLHPIWGQDILENLLIHEGDHWLHCSAKLHYTLFHMARLLGNQWLSLFHTVVESLGVHEGLLWLLKLMVPTAKWWIWGGMDWYLSPGMRGPVGGMVLSPSSHDFIP